MRLVHYMYRLSKFFFIKVYIPNQRQKFEFLRPKKILKLRSIINEEFSTLPYNFFQGIILIEF